MPRLDGQGVVEDGAITAVATSTTGLIAGAAKRNVRAAAGATPRAIKLLVIGTEAHSQPGNSAPDRPATGTAKAPLLGRTRRNTAGDTNAAIPALSSTPRARKGTACTTIAINIVDHVLTAGESKKPCRNSAGMIQSNRATATTGPQPGIPFATCVGGWLSETFG